MRRQIRVLIFKCRQVVSGTKLGYNYVYQVNISYKKSNKLILAYCYKLRPNPEQSTKIDSWIDLLRATYNWSLADRINTYYQRYICGEYCDHQTKAVITPLACAIGGATGEPWRENGKKRSAVESQITALPELKKARPWSKKIESTVLQQNLKRLNTAFDNFFKGRGFPQFKNRSTFSFFTYASGVNIKGNKIYLPKLGWCRFFNSRSIPNKKRPSKNKRKAQKRLSRFQHRIAVKREAYQWQGASEIVQKSDAIAVEDLNIAGMIKRCQPNYDEKKGRFLKNGPSAKRALNRLIADASWYSLTQKIEYMAAKSEKVVLRVNPGHTSQECSVCHHIDPNNREGEKFLCVNCGHSNDANFQAALNIKNKAIDFYQLNIKKTVRRDLPEPKQLSLFETPTVELTTAQRRYHYALKGQRNEPGNLKEYTVQLSLFNQENNHPVRDSL